MIIQPDSAPAPPPYDALYEPEGPPRPARLHEKSASSTSLPTVSASASQPTSPSTPSSSSSRQPSKLLRRKLEKHRRTVSVMRVDIIIFAVVGVLVRFPQPQRFVLDLFSYLNNLIPPWFQGGLHWLVENVFAAGFESSGISATAYACMVAMIILSVIKLYWRKKGLDELESVVLAAERSEASGNVEGAAEEIWKYMERVSGSSTAAQQQRRQYVLNIDCEPLVNLLSSIFFPGKRKAAAEERKVNGQRLADQGRRQESVDDIILPPTASQ